MNTAKYNQAAGIMLFFTAIFNIADYFLTMEALRAGMEEWNPLVRYWIDTGLLAFVKIILIPAVLLLIWKVRTYLQPRLSLYAGIVFTAYLLLMVYFAVLFNMHRLSSIQAYIYKLLYIFYKNS